LPLPFSSLAVFRDLSELSSQFSHETYQTAYGPFTPSNSGQRSPPTSYRGCWHVVSRDLFIGYRPYSFPIKEVYNPKAFILHATSLHQAFAHCGRFLAAASRRSEGRVSVPLWLFVLTHQLPVFGLASRYLANYLIGRKPIQKRPAVSRYLLTAAFQLRCYAVLAQVSLSYPPLLGRLLTCYSAVCH